MFCVFKIKSQFILGYYMKTDFKEVYIYIYINKVNKC